MKILKIIISLTALLSLISCASMFVPDEDKISKLPIIEMGDKKPEGNEFILHIPAGMEFPVNLTVKGGLISAPVNSKSMTKVNRELYIYKYWTSFDGKKWQPTNEVIKMPIIIGVDPEGAQIHVKAELHKKQI